MRAEGVIKTWNDERGFGFIEPAAGGPQVFVHIKSFEVRSVRPSVGYQVSFEMEVGAEGKPRAMRVRSLRASPNAPAVRRGARTRPGAASYFAILVFALCYLAIAAIWRVPIWVAGLYGGVSIVAIIFYAIDKAAARANAGRISENTLLLLGLLGGWPGAIVAQQVLRHKSSKPSFRIAFWFTVAVNVMAFVFLASPLGRQLLRW